MQENIKGLYAAFKAKDARFDGRFFRWHIVYGNLLPSGLQSQTAQSGKLHFFQDGRRCGTGRLQALPFVQAGTCSRDLCY